VTAPIKTRKQRVPGVDKGKTWRAPDFDAVMAIADEDLIDIAKAEARLKSVNGR
jgi:hypothetical protein